MCGGGGVACAAETPLRASPAPVRVSPEQLAATDTVPVDLSPAEYLPTTAISNGENLLFLVFGKLAASACIFQVFPTYFTDALPLLVIEPVAFLDKWIMDDER